MKNINTQKYWNKIYSNPAKYLWRNYPTANKLICNEIGKDRKVIEIGCGHGVLLEQLRKKGNKVSGIEISDRAVQICRTKGLNVIQADFLATRFEVQQKDDFAVATEFLEHFPPEEMPIILNKMKQLAKKTILVGPNNCLYPIECQEPYNFFTETTIEEDMKKVFTKVKIKVFEDKIPDTSIVLPSIMVVCE